MLPFRIVLENDAIIYIFKKSVRKNIQWELKVNQKNSRVPEFIFLHQWLGVDRLSPERMMIIWILSI